MLVYDAAEGPVSEFVGGCSYRDPGLEKLVIKEYADDGTAIEAMRGLMELTQAWDYAPVELGARAMKLSLLVSPIEVKENVTIQPQLADFFIDELENERIKHDVKVRRHQSDWQWS